MFPKPCMKQKNRWRPNGEIVKDNLACNTCTLTISIYDLRASACIYTGKNQSCVETYLLITNYVYWMAGFDVVVMQEEVTSWHGNSRVSCRRSIGITCHIACIHTAISHAGSIVVVLYKGTCVLYYHDFISDFVHIRCLYYVLNMFAKHGRGTITDYLLNNLVILCIRDLSSHEIKWYLFWSTFYNMAYTCVIYVPIHSGRIQASHILNTDLLFCIDWFHIQALKCLTVRV